MIPELPSYPGRGVVAYRDPRGTLWWAYFLTGRSDASKDRSFNADDTRVRVVPTKARPERDVLRHYSCVRKVGDHLVVGNGDHVDLIADALEAGQHLSSVIERIDPEPDPPINTARIAVVATDRDPTVEVLCVFDDSGMTRRIMTSFDLDIGSGLLVHTYGGDTTDVISDARPRLFAGGDAPITEITRDIWAALAPDLRVALITGRVAVPIPEAVLGSDLI